jgi:glycerophosphoryl diester phosphodiesterase
MSATIAKTAALHVLSRQQVLVIAHRGFSRLAPENTLPAFALALAAESDLVELDVRASGDGKLVAVHDRELDRTTDATRRWHRRHNRVDAKSAAEIQTLDAGGWFDGEFAGAQIPLLSEAVSRIRKGSIPLIERKAGSPEAYLGFLREGNLVNEVIVQSFDWDFLRALHQAEPRLVLGSLGPAELLAGGRKPLGISRKLNAAWLNQVEKTGARVVVWSRKVSKGAVRLAHERGLKVWIYTINDLKLAQRLIDAGVDGLITNDPILIRKAESRGRGGGAP